MFGDSVMLQGFADSLDMLVGLRMENPVSNTETVKAIYEAFGRGDVTTILDKLDDAVEWETAVPLPDVPWLQARRGKANASTTT